MDHSTMIIIITVSSSSSSSVIVVITTSVYSISMREPLMEKRIFVLLVYCSIAIFQLQKLICTALKAWKLVYRDEWQVTGTHV